MAIADSEGSSQEAFTVSREGDTILWGSGRIRGHMRGDTWGAIVIVGILYFGIALAVIGTHSLSVGSAMNNASLAQVMSNTIEIGNGAIVTAFIALMHCLGTTNAFVASISRLAYSLAHERVAPSWFDHINKVDQHRNVPFSSSGHLLALGSSSHMCFTVV